MAMNRLGQQPDIIQILRSIDRCQREKKENQIVGADAVETFLVRTDREWDWIGSTSFEGSAKIKRLRVSFVPEKETIAGLKLQAAHEVVGLSGVSLTINSVREPIIQGQAQVWNVTIVWFGDQEIRVKFFVSATGRGTIFVI